MIRHPITAKKYVDLDGNEFEVKGSTWEKSLGSEILILDIDTRLPDGENEIFNEKHLNWKAMDKGGMGMVSAAFMNHYLYCESSRRRTKDCGVKRGSSNNRQPRSTVMITSSSMLRTWRICMTLG